MTLRIVSQGTTVIKSITVGTPVGIADPSVGRLTRLDDVDLGVDSVGLLPADQSLFWNADDQVFQFADPGLVIRSSLSAANLGGDGSLAYDSENGIFQYTGPVASEVRAHFSAIDSGGDGAFSYDESTGVFTYRGPSASEVRAHITTNDAGGDGSLTYDNTTGIIEYTGPSPEETRLHFSVVDSGGDGSLLYDNTSGVFTYIGPSAAEVRAHFEPGAGLSYDESGGVFSMTTLSVDSGTYGSASEIPILTINNRGQVDSAGSISIAGVQSTTWTSATNTLTINTVDGQSFETVFDSFGGGQSLANLLVDGTTTLNDATTINGDLDLNGSLTVSGNILPDTNVAYDIGDSGLRFNELWLSGSTIHLGTLNLKDSGGVLAVIDTNGDIAAVELAQNTTDDLAEGSTNLYYTDQRARSTQSVTTTSGTSDLFSYDSTTGVLATSDSDIARTDIHEVFHEGLNIPDGKKIVFCDQAADMFELGGNLYIRRLNSAESDGNIFVSAKDGNSIEFNNASGTRAIAHFHDGEDVQLYYNGDKKFETTDSGGKITGNLDVTGELEVDGSVLITGNLQVDGTTTTINSTTLSVNDKNIVLADSAVDSASADGAGITVAGAGATITYNYATDRWEFNRPFERNINLLSDHSTTDLSEGSNRYYTLARADSDARHAVSVTDNGGDGSLSYDADTGVISYTGPSATEVRAHLVAGRRLDYDSASGVFDVTVQAEDVAGTYGGNADVPVFSVDSHGFVTSITTTAINAVTSFTYDSATGVFTIGTTGDTFALPYDLSAFTTTGLTEGDNLYYTKVRTDSDVNQGFADRSTTDLAEGNNLYYTTARADSAIDDRVTKTFIDALNVDADTLDGISSESFLRSDVADVKTSGSLSFDNDVQLKIGEGNALSLSHDGNDTYITNNLGVLYTQGNTVSITNAAGSSTYGYFANGVGARLYHNSNVERFRTSDSGGTVTGNLTVTGSFTTITTNGLTEGTSNLYYTKTRVDSDVNQGFADRSTTDLLEGDNLYYTTARADSDARYAISVSGDLTYNPATGVISVDVEQVYSKANFDSDLGDASTTILPEGDNLYYTKSRVDSDVRQGFEDRTTTDLDEGNNLYYTTARADSDARHSINVVDNGGDGSLTYTAGTGDIVYTGPSASEIRSHFSSSADLSYDSATGQFSIDVEQVYSKANFDSDLGDASTSILPEGSNLYYTTARADSDAKNAVSVTDAGGDGSLSYNASTGVITYTGPSAAEVRAHINPGTGTHYDSASGVVSIGQAVETTSDVTFNSIENTSGDMTTQPTEVLINSSAETVIDQFAHNNEFTSFEYIIHMVDSANDDTQISKMLGTFNKTTVSSNEFGTVFTGSTDFGDLNITADGTNIKLVITKYGSIGNVRAKASKTIIK